MIPCNIQTINSSSMTYSRLDLALLYVCCACGLLTPVLIITLELSIRLIEILYFIISMALLPGLLLANNHTAIGLVDVFNKVK